MNASRPIRAPSWRPRGTGRSASMKLPSGPSRTFPSSIARSNASSKVRCGTWWVMSRSSMRPVDSRPSPWAARRSSSSTATMAKSARSTTRARIAEPWSRPASADMPAASNALITDGSTGSTEGSREPRARRDFPVSFDRASHGLARAHAATFAGLVFVSLHERPPDLEEWLGSIRDALRAALGGDGRLRLLGYQKVEFAANWKVYIDDEGYHAPLLHRAFQILQWRGGEGSQRRDPNGHRITRTRSGARPDTRLLRDPDLIAYRGGNDPRNKFPDQAAGSLLVTPWPLGAVMNHLDVINIRLANPVDPARTEVHYAYFAHADDEPDMARHRLRQSSNLIGPSGFISLEDGAVFARIQRGTPFAPRHHPLRPRLARRCRLRSVRGLTERRDHEHRVVGGLSADDGIRAGTVAVERESGRRRLKSGPYLFVVAVVKADTR